MIGAPDLTREAIALDAAALEPCAGVYRFELGQNVPFRAKDGALTSRFPRFGSVYRPFGERAFFLESDPEMTLMFDDLEDGLFQSLVIAGYGEPVRWTRAAAPTPA